MRELNVDASKVRRSSFSNTLSGLPEVEEPYHADVVSPVPEVPTEALIGHSKLPSLTIVESLAPKSRPRIHTLPTGSKSDIHGQALRRRLSSEQPAAKGTNIQKGASLEKSSPRGLHMSLSQPYVTSLQADVRQPEVGRRWSIGSPVSQIVHEAELPARRLSKGTGNEKNSQGARNTESTGNATGEKEAQRNNLTSSWNRSGSPRKFSDPSLLISEKDRFEILEDPMLNRRWSNPTFAETAKKVNMVLRLGQNMRNKRNPSKTKQEERKMIRTLADFAVDMPKIPRFSAMMSPEAQFSLMMGYEDKIYDRLAKESPEYQKALKRNKTPVEKVRIRRKNSIGFIDDDSDNESCGESEDEASEQNHSTRSSFLTQPTESDSCQSFIGKRLLGTKYQQHRGSTQSLDSSTSELSERPDSRTTLRNLRRLSVSLEKKHYLNRLFDKVDDDTDGMEGIPYQNIPRSCSLPNVGGLPFSRRLMMTHRLESAMDILDAMKCHGELFLSPRLRRKKSVPLADYNSWVHEWNKEFRFDHGKF